MHPREYALGICAHLKFEKLEKFYFFKAFCGTYICDICIIEYKLHMIQLMNTCQGLMYIYIISMNTVQCLILFTYLLRYTDVICRIEKSAEH